MPELPTIAYKNKVEWETWLSKNYTDTAGIWMIIGKKTSATPSINYKEALDAALCYGWIDGQKKTYDQNSYLQKFTPRRVRSVWSKVNVGHVARLIAAGEMQPSGQAQVDAAKQDGRWDQAYDSSSTAIAPTDFLDELDQHPQAKKFFATLNKANTYAIFYRLQTAKKIETRQRRMQQIIDMLSRAEKFH